MTMTMPIPSVRIGGRTLLLGASILAMAVVAGGSSGIGRACVELLQREGAKVVVLDLADADRPVNITDEGAVSRFFDDLPHAPDVAVNAVGDANLELLLDQPVSEFRRIVEIELVGPYIFTQHAARRMVAEGRNGSIINITSEQEQVASRGLSGHCSAKAGLSHGVWLPGRLPSSSGYT